MDNVLNNIADKNESNAVSAVSVVADCDTGIQDKKSKAVAKNVDTNKVLEYFKESIDTTNSYTLDEYKKLITTAFKEAAKKTSKRTSKSGKAGLSIKKSLRLSCSVSFLRMPRSYMSLKKSLLFIISKVWDLVFDLTFCW